MKKLEKKQKKQFNLIYSNAKRKKRKLGQTISFFNTHYIQ